MLGLDVLMGYTGQVSLGQAGFMAVGGYTAAILATNYGWPPLAAIAPGILLSLACAIALSLATMRLRGHYLALATLAFGLLIDSLTVGMTETTGGPSGLVGIPSFSIGPYSFDTAVKMYYLVAALIGRTAVAAPGRNPVQLRARAAGGAHRPDGGERARGQRAAPQDGSVRDQRRARVAFGQPVRLLLPLPVARDGRHATLARDDHHARAGRRRHAGRVAVRRGAAHAAAHDLPTASPLYKTLAEGALLVLAVRYLPGGIFGSIAQLLSGQRAAPLAAGALAPQKEAR